MEDLQHDDHLINNSHVVNASIATASKNIKVDPQHHGDHDEIEEASESSMPSLVVEMDEQKHDRLLA